MKFYIILIFYIFGICFANLSVKNQRNQNVAECDQENIEDLDVEDVIKLTLENENCRNEAMEIIDRKYYFTKVYIYHRYAGGYSLDKGVLT